MTSHTPWPPAEAAPKQTALPTSFTLPHSRIASLFLVGSNLVILFMAAFRQWGYEYILALLWWETVIIGFFNLGRILLVSLKADGIGKHIGFANLQTRLAVAFWLSALFIVKFGGFALGVGLLVLLAPAAFVDDGTSGIGPALDAAGVVGAGIIPAIVLLFISHGVSFFRNFVGRQEYRWTGLFRLLLWPYVRLTLLMAVVILGFLVAQANPSLGNAPGFTLVVIILKLVVDWGTHRFEHRSGGKTGVAGEGPAL